MAPTNPCASGRTASTRCDDVGMDILERSWEFQHRLEERAKRLGKGRYGRILKMARKPTSDEYTKVVQITGLGLIIVGGIGFLIFYLMEELPGALRSIFGI